MTSQRNDGANRPLIRPFSGLRPKPGMAGEVAAPPYDVLDSEEARARAADNRWSFLHISKAEIDLAPGLDAKDPEVYRQAARNMAAFREAGVLVVDPAPGYYVYRMSSPSHSQTGIVAAGSLTAYRQNRIRRHELTRPDKEDDRVRQIEAVGAQTGPVLVAHPPSPALDAVMARASVGAPVSEAMVDGVCHRLWVVSDGPEMARISAAFEAMEAIYIGDGHHRSAAAARVSARAAERDGPDPKSLADYFLIVSFAIDVTPILPYNRVVRDLNGLSVAGFLKALDRDFTVSPAGQPGELEAGRGEFAMYLDGGWHRLNLRRPAADGGGPAERLDVSRLTDHLLTPVLGIGDPRADPRIDFVGGPEANKTLRQRVDGQGWAVAFALAATPMADLVAIADAGQVMPPKSTWFEPKLADGMVSLVID